MRRNAFPVVKKDEKKLKKIFFTAKKRPEPEDSSRLLVFSYIRLPLGEAPAQRVKRSKKAKFHLAHTRLPLLKDKAF